MNSMETFFYGPSPVQFICDDDGEIWVVAKGVCDVLGTATRDIPQILDSDEHKVVPLSQVTADVENINLPGGGNRPTTIISEAGFYSLVLRSRKPEAKPFRRWVTHDVIPTIHRAGTYTLSKPSRKEMAQWVIDAEERAEVAEQALVESEDYAKKLEPYAGRWMAMMEVDGAYSAKIASAILSNDANIDLGQNILFKFMGKQRWVHRGRNVLGSEIWIPYRSEIAIGRLKPIPYEQPVIHPRTGKLVALEPKVGITWKGIDTLHILLGGTKGVKPSRLAGAPEGELQALPPVEEA
jgi:anti-repressor protein